MELIRKSAINDTWKLCTIAGFLGLFLLTLLITTNTPQTFQISISTTTAAVEVSSSPEESKSTSSGAGSAEHAMIPGSQGANISDDAVLFQWVNVSSPPESGSESSTLAGDEIPAGEANFSNTSSASDAVLFQSFNSSAIEEKLFSSFPEVDRNATAGGEYGIPTGDTKYDNSTSMKEDEDKMVMMSGGEEKKCRMYEGRWVYKPEENPMYHVSQCEFLEEKMSCRRNGRPDFEYERWGWESDGCHVPLFNGTDMMERLRGKRMIMAGDSLNRNQWESLACLLYTSISPRRAYVDASDPTYKVFRAKDYEFTLEFYWAPFLVHLDENHKSNKKVLSLDNLVPSSEQWRGADVMVFNSGHWWTHHGKFRAWDVFECDGEQVEEVEKQTAYERALTVWAQWVAHNVDPAKTKVYFRSISPEHKGNQWCFNHSRPMGDEEPYDQQYPRALIDAVERKIKEINGQDDGALGVRYLNITGLSSHRIDAHPSIYRFKHWKVIMDKYKRLLKSRSDCSHWCLPGLPDTWNRILYASLFFDHLVAGDLSGS